MPVYDQIEIACEQIRNDPNLQDGYHAVGFSQGLVIQGRPSPVRSLRSSPLISEKDLSS